MTDGPDLSTEYVATGSAYGSDPAHHHIVNGAFVCSAPDDAKCRTFPTCECENWCCCETPGENHDEGNHCCMTSIKAGQSCWLTPWVEAMSMEDSHADQDDEVVPPIGDEDWRWPDGPVSCDWDDGIWWSYTDTHNPPESKEQP